MSRHHENSHPGPNQTPDQTPDQRLDAVLEELRGQSMSSSELEQAAARVRRRLDLEAHRGAASAPAIGGCEDFRSLIPAYLDGELTPARALLLEDHTRSCVPCRRALKSARSQALVTALPTAAKAESRGRWFQGLRWAAALAVAVVLGWGLWAALGIVPLPWGPPAVVEQVDGTLYQLTRDGALPVAAGQEVPYGVTLRSDRDGAAVVRLADGSQLELGPRAELAVERRRDGTTIHLHRGHLIVEAAPQGRGHLFVATDDCLVSVRGTIFAVNHGTKGSRVSVVEGEVAVGYGSRQAVLGAGQQIATHPSIAPVPVAQEVAWSRHFDEYLELLREIRGLSVDLQAALPDRGLRFSSPLLELMPEDTAVFAALPNVGGDLDDAYAILTERVATSPVLSRWWQESFADGDDEMRDALGRLARFSELLGGEVVVGLIPEPEGEEPRIVLLAQALDAETLRGLIRTELDAAGTGDAVTLVDDLDSLPADSETGLLVRVSDGLMAVASRASDLRAVAVVAAGGANPFASQLFHSRLEQAYTDGVDWLVGADMAALVSQRAALGEDEDDDVLARTGILDVDTLILKRQRDSRDHVLHRAELSFDGPRRGLAAWLASPAPMASLDFVSPDAHLVTAALVQDPERMLTDLLGIFPAGAGLDLQEQIETLRRDHGIDLMEDLAAPLGGEVAFALDGPLLPKPSWKVVLEVYDPARLQSTIERAVTELRSSDAEHGDLTLDSEQSGGQTFYRLAVAGSAVELHYAFVDGYLLLAPSRALIERAVGYRDSGYTLVRSARFSSLLPPDGHANFSALSYQNLQPVLGPLAQLWSGEAQGLSDEQRMALEQFAADAPASLACAYGEDDRIVLVNDSEGDFVANLLAGAAGLLGGGLPQADLEPPAGSEV